MELRVMTSAMASNEVISGLSCNIRDLCLMRLLISTPPLIPVFLGR